MWNLQTEEYWRIDKEKLPQFDSKITFPAFIDATDANDEKQIFKLNLQPRLSWTLIKKDYRSGDERFEWLQQKVSAGREEFRRLFLSVNTSSQLLPLKKFLWNEAVKGLSKTI